MIYDMKVFRERMERRFNDKARERQLLETIYSREVLSGCLCDDELTFGSRARVNALIAAGDVEATVEDGKTYYTVTDQARERLGVL